MCALTHVRIDFFVVLPHFSSNQRSKRQPEKPELSQANLFSNALSGVALCSTSARSSENISGFSKTFNTLLWHGSLVMLPLAWASRRSVINRRADMPQ